MNEYFLHLTPEFLERAPAETAAPNVYELAAARAKIDRLEKQLKHSQQELAFVKELYMLAG